MPIETLDDIIEEIANDLGVYGCCNEESDDCECRKCWACGIRQRIERAVEIERRLGEAADA